jgi:hypothetical protein
LAEIIAGLEMARDSQKASLDIAVARLRQIHDLATTTIQKREEGSHIPYVT